MENIDEKDKKVDESWKESTAKEKVSAEQAAAAKTEPKGQQDYPQEINFGLFLSGLMIEGLISLGDVENPLTKKKEMNLEQAKYIIDVISMLNDKTKNNLDADEKAAIDQILYELRMRYVAKAKTK